MTTPLSLPTGSWVMDDKRASGRRLVNCFSEIGPQTGSQDLKSTLPPAYLRRMFGISPYASALPFASASMTAATVAPSIETIATGGGYAYPMPNNGNGSNASSGTISAHTTNADYLLLMVVANDSSRHSGTTFNVTVTSPTLTWTKYASDTITDPYPEILHVEFWSAPVASALTTTEVITVGCTRNIPGVGIQTADVAGYWVGGVIGAAPGLFDTTPATPPFASQTWNGSVTVGNPMSLALTTSSANDLLVYIANTYNPNITNNSPTGWTAYNNNLVYTSAARAINNAVGSLVPNATSTALTSPISTSADAIVSILALAPVNTYKGYANAYGSSSLTLGSITPTPFTMGGSNLIALFTTATSTPTLTIGFTGNTPAAFTFNFTDANNQAWNFTWDGVSVFKAGGPYANSGATHSYNSGTNQFTFTVTYPSPVTNEYPAFNAGAQYPINVTAGSSGGGGVGSLPVRGIRTMAGITYVVIGNTLYSMTNTGTYTNPTGGATLTAIASGIISNGLGFVRMCDNTECLFILVPGTNTGYTYTVNNGLQQCLDESFLFYGAIDVWFIDSYLVFLALNGREFYNDDGQTVSGTGPITFTTGGVFPREFGTDEFVGMCVDHRTVHMFGQLTTEAYVDVGNATESPFAAAPDGFMQIGCNTHCGYTVALQDQSVFWVANDLTVRRLNGQTPVRVSNSGIEAMLEDNKLLLYGAYALTPTIGGHPLWVLTLPLAQKTVAYDCLTTEWFDLSSNYNDVEYWRPLCWYNAQGLQLVGDSQFSQIGYLDEQTFTEWGLPMVAQAYTQSVYDNHNRITHERVEAVVTVGQGGTLPGLSPPGTTGGATITLFKSDDAGYTWTAREGKPLGPLGSPRTSRAVWWKLGQSRDRAYRFDISDPTQFFMVAIVTEVSGGKW